MMKTAIVVFALFALALCDHHEGHKEGHDHHDEAHGDITTQKVIDAHKKCMTQWSLTHDDIKDSSKSQDRSRLCFVACVNTELGAWKDHKLDETIATNILKFYVKADDEDKIGAVVTDCHKKAEEDKTEDECVYFGHYRDCIKGQLDKQGVKAIWPGKHHHHGPNHGKHGESSSSEEHHGSEHKH